MIGHRIGSGRRCMAASMEGSMTVISSSGRSPRSCLPGPDRPDVLPVHDEATITSV